MTRPEAVEQLQDLRADRLSFVADEADYTYDIYCRDIEALDIAIKVLSTRKASVPRRLTEEDWSRYTIDEIAEMLGSNRSTVTAALSRLRAKGINVIYRRLRKGRPPKKETVTDETEA